MARRPAAVTTPKRVIESEANAFSNLSSPAFKSKSSSFISVCVVLVAAVFIIGYMFGDSVFHQTSHRDSALDGGIDPSFNSKIHSLRKMSSSIHEFHHLTTQEETEEESADHISRQEDHQSSHSNCQVGVCGALPILQEVYGKYMYKVLHIGADTCGVVPKLQKEENVQVWGIQPFETVKPIYKLCHSLIKKGIVRVAEVYRPLPYRSRSFSLVVASDTLEHLSSKRLNKTLPELSRLASHRLVVFIGSQNSQTLLLESMDTNNERRKLINSSIVKPKTRNRAWWLHRFELAGLTEDRDTTKRFEMLQEERSYKTNDFIFHLIVPQSIYLSR